MFLRPLEPVHHSTFSRVIVWDDRPDTTRIGKEKRGTVIRFNTSASRTIADCIQAAISPDPERDRTILIDINKLDISPDDQSMGTAWNLDFSADIYKQEGDSLWLKISSYSRSRHLNYSIGSGIEKILSSVIGAIDVGLTVTKDTLPVALTQGPVILEEAGVPGISGDQKGDIALRKDYPIFHRMGPFRAGYYPRFGDFRDDSLVPCNYVIKAVNDDDSLYTLFANDVLAKATFEKNTPAKGAFTNDAREKEKTAKEFIDSIWAYADTAGNLYIHVLRDQFVPLTKRANTFYFFIPHTLPDMYSIQRIKDKLKNFNPDAFNTGFQYTGGGNLLTIPLAIIASCVIDAGINSTATLIHNAQVKKIEKSGMRSGNFRNCRLDMDNGVIQY